MNVDAVLTEWPKCAQLCGEIIFNNGVGHRDIPADHLYLHAGLQHDVHRLWVDPPVEFGEWRDVAWEHSGAAHQHAALHPAGELRLNANGEGKVGERPKRNELEFAWLLAEGFNHFVHRVVACCLAALQW